MESVENPSRDHTTFQDDSTFNKSFSLFHFYMNPPNLITPWTILEEVLLVLLCQIKWELCDASIACNKNENTDNYWKRWISNMKGKQSNFSMIGFEINRRKLVLLSCYLDMWPLSVWHCKAVPFPIILFVFLQFENTRGRSRNGVIGPYLTSFLDLLKYFLHKSFQEVSFFRCWMLAWNGGIHSKCRFFLMHTGDPPISVCERGEIYSTTSQSLKKNIGLAFRASNTHKLTIYTHRMLGYICKGMCSSHSNIRNNSIFQVRVVCIFQWHFSHL